MQQSVTAGLMQVLTSRDPAAECSCDHISTTGTIQDKATEVHIAVYRMYTHTHSSQHVGSKLSDQTSMHKQLPNSETGNIYVRPGLQW